MKNTKRYCSLFCALMLIGVVSTPVYSAISFSTSPKVYQKTIKTVKYLDSSNPSLRRALNIHNMMNEISGILDVMTTGDDLDKQRDIFSEQKDALSSCYSKKLGGVFKEPKTAWNKMADTYEQKRLAVPEKEQDKDSLVPSVKSSKNTNRKNMDISREVMMDVYQNPAKWGEVNKGASFPLWQDQSVVFEKQWNDYYDKMNTAFGAPKEGRPNVDEKTRQDVKKYNQVLKAHKEYLASLQSKKKMEYSELPPKAPQPLPAWNEIMMVEADGKTVYPEMPEVWKDAKTRKELIKANPNGELAQVFENGDTNTPTASAMMANQSSLEQEFQMRLMMDSLEKGTSSFNNTTRDMQQDFKNRLSELGIDTTDLKLETRGDYFKVRKVLKEEKDKAISEAEKYIARLEKQDAEHPELVEKRRKKEQAKRSRMSEKAQEQLEKSDEGIVQISQMSPATQQKLVVDALKKDSDALVYLTETNAMDVDQLMRERKSTNKIIVESQKQMQDVYKRQVDMLPNFKEQCPF